FAAGMFGITAEEMEHLGDDRLGRALDRLFDADRAALLTDVVLAVGQAFALKFDEFQPAGQRRNPDGPVLRLSHQSAALPAGAGVFPHAPAADADRLGSRMSSTVEPPPHGFRKCGTPQLGSLIRSPSAGRRGGINCCIAAGPRLSRSPSGPGCV